MKTLIVSIVAVSLSLVGRPAWAADKTHQQMMAEIRMLQEQQQQLAQMLGGLADTLKTVTTRIDDQAASSRKASADQKLLIDGIAEGVRILREKADDTNVRLSSMTQEMETIRQTIASIQAAPSPAAGVSAAVDPGTGAALPVTPPAPVPMVSADKAYTAAFNDYSGGQYDLAVEGFNFYLKTFPRSDRADDAQLNIGNSYYAQGNYREAVTAFQKVIANYAQADTVPAAYYKLGLSYEGLKQVELARRAYETVIKSHPNAMDAQLARQRLDSLNRR
ncbi:MAG TPA: tol-pal system protein YbgF [Vicinamibacterales bacterium]|nr:tol-pal system protein YbgF [Vicinamibacterales bacterium]